MEHAKELHLLGVSYRTAPAAVREALSFSRLEAAALLREAASEIAELEAVVLSTCNRSEFYLAVPAGSGAVESWLARICSTRPGAPILRSDCLRYQSSGSEAARHLFHVASGLDSAVLGDVQILGQVKEAMAVAAESATLGGVLDRTFCQAIRVGKRARKETAIGRGAASTGSALVGMICERSLSRESGRVSRVLIIGAGEIARDIGRHAAKRGLWELVFINRTVERARELAGYCGGRGQEWSSLRSALMEADIAIAATAASQPILRREMLEEVAAMRSGRPLLVIDAGLPRNVEEGSSVEVIDIDAIRERQDDVLEQRRAAVPGVEDMVEGEVKAWERWHASLPLEGVIKELYQEVSAHSRQAARTLATSGALTVAQTEQIISRSLKQLLHPHVRRLRRSA